jgi:hypothetical protein
MDQLLLFGLSIALSFVTWSLVAKYYFWPALRTQPGRAGFRPILLLHSARFIGLAFLIPGVVSPQLPLDLTRPAAYGDLIAALLALAALATLQRRFGLLLLWCFNLWGTADLLVAYYHGLTLGIEPGQLGAMYFVPTVLVPLLLVTHGLAFRLLLAAPQHAA